MPAVGGVCCHPASAASLASCCSMCPRPSQLRAHAAKHRHSSVVERSGQRALPRGGSVLLAAAGGRDGHRAAPRVSEASRSMWERAIECHCDRLLRPTLDFVHLHGRQNAGPHAPAGTANKPFNHPNHPRAQPHAAEPRCDALWLPDGARSLEGSAETRRSACRVAWHPQCALERCWVCSALLRVCPSGLGRCDASVPRRRRAAPSHPVHSPQRSGSAPLALPLPPPPGGPTSVASASPSGSPSPPPLQQLFCRNPYHIAHCTTPSRRLAAQLPADPHCRRSPAFRLSASRTGCS